MPRVATEVEGEEVRRVLLVARVEKGDELARAEKWLTEAPVLKDGVADLLWVLVNSREFLFNH